MVLVRAIAGIVVGYVAYAAASMALLTMGMGAEGTIVAIGALVALATLANLFMGLGAEPIWYKIGTLVLTVPAMLIIGHLEARTH